jgi:hypothetical protein
LPHQRLLKNILYLVLILGIAIILAKVFLVRRLLFSQVKELFSALKSIDLVTYLSIVLICVFIATLFTAYNFPLYPDEIAVRFWLSRMPYEFPQLNSGLPRCVSTFAQSIPLTMYFPALIDWVVHGTLESPTSLRRVGVVGALLWVLGFTLYLAVKAKNINKRPKPWNFSLQDAYIPGFVIALFSIGVFPIFLVTNRPEQIILPAVVLLILTFIASGNLKTRNTWLSKTVLVLSYFAGISLALYAHPKSLFLTPLFVIVGWKLFSHFKTRLPFILAMSLLAFHVVTTVFTFKYAFQCSEMPTLESHLQSFSFDPASLFYAPRYFFEQLVDSLSRSSLYWTQIGFLERPEVGYLPTSPLSIYAHIANLFIKINLTILFFIMVVFLPYHYYRKDVVTGRVVTVNLILFILVLCGIISAIFNLPKHWYDAGYLYALSLIVVVFFVGENFSGEIRRKITRIIFLYLGSVALLSQVIFINRNLPVFLDGFTGPGKPIGVYEEKQYRNDLMAATKACDIDPRRSKKLVVDDWTYGYLRKSKLPMPFTFIWLDNNEKDRQLFFSKVDSDGMVVSCSSVPTEYRQLLTRTGNICCASKKDVARVFALP